MKIKKLLSIITLFGLLLSFFQYSIAALEKEYNWYCIRSGNRQPKISAEELMINEYGGYSIDRRVNDNSDEKIIYLTFDCGYVNENVEKILDIMKEEGVCGAFFLLDNPILKNTETVKRMAEDGHLLCNHTKNHKNISSYTREQIEKNLTDLEKLCMQKAEVKMAKIFRFPEGKYSISALKHLKSLGYTTVFWSFAYDDWDNARQMSCEKAMKKVLSNTHNGAVMLFHPTSRVNAEIFHTLIREWKRQGYRFGALDTLQGASAE